MTTSLDRAEDESGGKAAKQEISQAQLSCPLRNNCHVIVFIVLQLVLLHLVLYLEKKQSSIEEMTRVVLLGMM